MKVSTIRRGIAGVLACSQIMLSLLASGLSPAYAQTLDTEPPRLSIDALEEADKSEAQVFTVTATDNQSIGSVTLFYRLDSESEFQDGEMQRSGESDRFSFTLPAEDISSSVNTVQYYIEARDDAGNRMLQGFSFDPLERVLLDQSESVSSNTPASSESTSLLSSLSTGQKVVIGVAGIIVIGALVSAGGGGSDGDSSGAGPGVPVEITVEPLNAFR